MRKVNAFTLSELLVVLVLSSIVVTLSFLALSNVQKQLRKITQTYEKQQTIGSLERMLNTDLNRYEADFDAKKRILFLKNDKDSISYQFSKKGIVKGTDSIALVPNKVDFFLDGKEVNSGVVDALEFSFSDTFSQDRFFVSKRKDAAYYINQ